METAHSNTIEVGPERTERGRFYWCDECDVYGRGVACWACGSDALRWNFVPGMKVPALWPGV